jgi:uncharacterized protein YaaR (DUF327 family)
MQVTNYNNKHSIELFVEANKGDLDAMVKYCKSIVSQITNQVNSTFHKSLTPMQDIIGIKFGEGLQRSKTEKDYNRQSFNLDEIVILC